MPTKQRWTSQFRNEVEIHFRQAAATLLGPTIARSNPPLCDSVSWALVRWLFVDDDHAHPDGDDDDEDVKDKEEALCVLGPGLLLEPSITRVRSCPLPELCGDPNPPRVVAQFTLAFVAAQEQRHREHRARQLRQCEERVMTVARRLWARVLTAAREQQHEGRSAVAVAVLLGGISLMFRVLRKAGAARDGSNLVGCTLEEGGLDAFGDHFTSCLLNHPHTAVVVAAFSFVATSAPFFHLLPLGPAPEDISRSRIYQQLRLTFHGAANSRIRCAVLQTLIRLKCPGLVQDLVERCAQETNTEVLVQLYSNGRAMVTQESFHLIESVVDVAQRGLNHYDRQVVVAAISTLVCVMMAYNERRSEEVDNVGHMIVRAVSRLSMSSEPGVESLLRLTAAHIAADERNGALPEYLPQELQDLISECRTARASRQRKNETIAVGVDVTWNLLSVLPACEPLWRALSPTVASRLVLDCSWQLRESGLLLLEVMSQVWPRENRELQAFVEKHWPFLVATLNDPVAQVRLRCCHTITSLLASKLPITRDHDRISQLVEEGFLVLLGSEPSRNSPARSPTTAEDDSTPALVFVEALALLQQLAKTETQLTAAAVQRAFVGYLACVAHIPRDRQPDLMYYTLQWFHKDKAPRVRLASAALVATIDEHRQSHDLRAIRAGLAFLVALWPHLDEDSRSRVVQCVVRVLADREFPDDVKASVTIQDLIPDGPDLQARVSAAIADL